MRSGFFASVLAAVLAVVLVAGAGAATRPSVRIAFGAGAATVRGTGFHARERVRVTVAVDAARKARVVRTASTGTFVATFAELPQPYDPCSDTLEVFAVGAAGERASLKFPARECPPKP